MGSSSSVLHDGIGLSSKPSFTKSRKILLDNADLEEFLEMDVDQVITKYSKLMSSRTRMAKKFGAEFLDDDMANSKSSLLKDIKAEYKELKAKVLDDPKALKKLKAREEKDLVDILALRDRLMGTYGYSINPDSWAYRTQRQIKQYNVVNMLGDVLISSLSDIGKLVMADGATKFLTKGLKPLAKSLYSPEFRKYKKLHAREMNRMGVGLDLINNGRVNAIGDIMDDFGKHTKFERAMDVASQKLMTTTGIKHWNGGLKQMASGIIQSSMHDAMHAVAKNTATKKQIANLASSGIDLNSAKAIRAQIKKHGEIIDDLVFPNITKWGGTAEEIQSIAEGRAKARNAEVLKENILPDTRGGGVFYHGSSSEIKSLDYTSTSVDNIYGDGFYTSEAKDAAATYQKKGTGGSPTLTRVTEKTPVTFFDLDQKIKKGSPEYKAFADEFTQIANYDDSAIDALEDLEKGFAKSYTEVLDTFRRGHDKNAFLESTNAIQERLRDLGFGGYTHTGGRLTKKLAPHKVQIYWDPKNQLDLQVEKPPAKVKEFKASDFEGQVADELRQGAKEFGQIYASAVKKAADSTIVTPGAGTTPLWMSRNGLTLFGQFQSFAFSSMQKTLIPIVQNFDSKTAQGLITMVGFGTLVAAYKRAARGEEMPDTATLIQEGVDRSGVTSWFMDYNNKLEKLAQGNVGLSRILGTNATNKYHNYNYFSALGPTSGQVTNILSIASDVLSGKADQSTVHSVRRLLPLQTMIGVRQTLDLMEEEFNNNLGIPKN
jgi:hypothetical protein